MPVVILHSPEYMRQRLCYEPGSGKLYWREWPANCPQWNGRYAGKEAFTAVNSVGYRHGNIDGSHLLAHRVAWTMAHGKWPLNDIDHINHVRDDNRLVNLRVATRSENLRNQVRSPRNTSGVTGVGKRNDCARWQARITVAPGEHVYLGVFNTRDEAIAARKAAEVKYGFHPNHGSEKPIREPVQRVEGVEAVMEPAGALDALRGAV